MIDFIVREALGPHGRAILDFWLENHLIISSIILLYGILVVSANRNLQNLAKKASELLGKDECSEKEIIDTLKSKDADFWNTLCANAQFPFISLPFSLRLYRVNQANLTRLLERFLSYKRKKK